MAAKILGLLLIIVLPWVAVVEIRFRMPRSLSAVDSVLVFLLVTLAAQIGLVVRRWGRIKVWTILLDLLLAVVAGAGSYAVVDLAVRRGGGHVDPFVVAVFMSYVLAIWSGQRR